MATNDAVDKKTERFFLSKFLNKNDPNLKFPYFRQPQEVGCFSLGPNREYLDSPVQLKYLHESSSPHVSFNLRVGYDSFISRDETVKEYINNLLQWVVTHRAVFRTAASGSTDRNLNTDFVCWRGLLTTLLTTPYENRDGWKVAVIHFKKTWYMCAFDTEQKMEEKQIQTDKQKEMSYWGYKFEQYMVTDDANSIPDTTKPVNSKEEFCSVNRGRLENHSVVFGGEVDCYVSSPSGRKKYIELKTSRIITHPRQDISFKRYKLIKWWAQSFLIGIEEIICGFRDDDGIVRNLETFKTMDIPKLCKTIPNSWNPSVCFQFLNKFLQLVKDTVTEDDPRKCHIFEWAPNSDITAQQSTDSSYLFLPDWYIKDMMAQGDTDTDRSSSYWGE